MSVAAYQPTPAWFQAPPGFILRRGPVPVEAPPDTDGIPGEYIEADRLAKAYLELAEKADVPRYTCEIPASWQPAPLVMAWVAKDFDAMRTMISIEGALVVGKSSLKQLKCRVSLDGRLEAPTTRRISKRTLKACLSDTDDRTTTTTTISSDASTNSLSLTTISHGAWTAGLPAGLQVLLTLPTLTRGRCTMNSIESHERFSEDLRRTYTHPGQLAGRVVHVVHAPWKIWSREVIQEMMERVRAEWRSISKQFGIFIMGKLCFAENSTKPHWHVVAIFPPKYNQAECAALSEVIHKRIDAVWTKSNRCRMKEGAWKLKKTAQEVKALVAYLDKYETNPGLDEPWGLPTFRIGPKPEAVRDEWEVRPHQFRKIWAAIEFRKRTEAHPWATGFKKEVDPRFLLMLLRRVGVDVTREQLLRYQLDW